MNVNITGNFLVMTDPLDIYLQNIGYDVAKSHHFYHMFFFEWNYPEARMVTENYINNIYVENSDVYSDNTPGYIILSRETGNVTITNVNWDNWYTRSSAISSCLIYAFIPTCLPTDSIPQTYYVENVTFDITIDEDGDRTVLSSFNHFFPHYRHIHATFK